ncbi:MAG: hypothetical protein ACRDOB_25285, partial [Streptosporangiaceae bacterium]
MSLAFTKKLPPEMWATSTVVVDVLETVMNSPKPLNTPQAAAIVAYVISTADAQQDPPEVTGT